MSNCRRRIKQLHNTQRIDTTHSTKFKIHIRPNTTIKGICESRELKVYTTQGIQELMSIEDRIEE